MKSFLISDNKDTIIGLRLAGIEGALAETKEDVEFYFSKAVHDPNVGIIIITEKIFEEMKEKVLDLKRTGNSQIIATIPDRTGLRDKNFIMRHIKESIGIKI
ncbi:MULTISPECIES: V-type ATP synthase subunit F [Tissierella]|uniref:V/A-type H+-transporting ATPase subunit F n=1 Tax=Tissierella praeacuta DSM 18095 TaxID=1123404 RepID=A0A1M4VRC0_9FIRM|nr:MULTISPECIES: V-type ATP synthase subunit F [Tissierella]MBU5256495.1 V-type ATP synthase subunit F [Tissierella praeacuta]SHE71651.1 V/A-type H+-transporting ATPase subunit F [Tissierella praeacuta DSM 18095]SUO98934.1 V-type ATP synthase subunit F [Tissierella praeacuta]HAE91826.1 ATP synthase subunit F [Tissierella sp.]